jgi:outer membrane protein
MKNLFRNTTAVIMAIALVAVAATISNLTTGKAGAAPDYAVIGHIDTDKLNSDFPMLKTAWEAVAAKKAELEKELNKKAEGQDADAKAKLVDQFNVLYNDYAKKTLDPAYAKLETTVKEVAKEKGVTVILNSSIVIEGGVDMTDAVLAKGGLK